MHSRIGGDVARAQEEGVKGQSRRHVITIQQHLMVKKIQVYGHVSEKNVHCSIVQTP